MLLEAYWALWLLHNFGVCIANQLFCRLLCGQTRQSWLKPATSLCRLFKDALFAGQTTKQPSGERVYRAALQSLHQLVMNGFRRTATYLSNGWGENQPLLFFASFPIYTALQMDLNASIWAAFVTVIIGPRKTIFLMTNSPMLRRGRRKIKAF